MENGRHRIEVRNEKESDVFYADGGPEALDIVKRALAGEEILRNFTEYPPPPAPELTTADFKVPDGHVLVGKPVMGTGVEEAPEETDAPDT